MQATTLLSIRRGSILTGSQFPWTLEEYDAERQYGEGETWTYEIPGLAISHELQVTLAPSGIVYYRLRYTDNSWKEQQHDPTFLTVRECDIMLANELISMRAELLADANKLSTLLSLPVVQP